MSICCDASGGRVVLTVNGVNYSTRGGIDLMPTNTEREHGANDDGSIYITTKPVPAEAQVTIADKCGLTLDLLEGCHFDVTLEFVDMKRTYLMTRATTSGRPSISSESGEISGMTIVSRETQLLENG